MADLRPPTIVLLRDNARDGKRHLCPTRQPAMTGGYRVAICGWTGRLWTLVAKGPDDLDEDSVTCQNCALILDALIHTFVELEGEA